MEREIPFKTSIDVGRIRKACRLAETVLHDVRDHIVVGTTTGQLDRIAEQMIRGAGALPSLKGYRDFPASICTSVNDVAAHGIPGDYELQDGDVICLDITVSVEGWYGDAAWTYVTGTGGPDQLRLVRATWQSVWAGIIAARAGASMGDIGHAITQTAASFGCTVIEEYVGHGIGRQMHEEPMVLHFGEPGSGLVLKPGMVFTIEPMLSLGGTEVKMLDDGWAVATADQSLTAQFEHTVAVFSDRTEVLTFSRFHQAEHLDFPPFIH
jgi:methionyl aminopeptidase